MTEWIRSVMEEGRTCLYVRPITSILHGRTQLRAGLTRTKIAMKVSRHILKPVVIVPAVLKCAYINAIVEVCFGIVQKLWHDRLYDTENYYFVNKHPRSCIYIIGHKWPSGAVRYGRSADVS